MLESHCPKCGAGRNEDGTLTLPKEWPVYDDCEECAKWNAERMKEFGKEWARLRNEHHIKIFKALMEKESWLYWRMK